MSTDRRKPSPRREPDAVDPESRATPDAKPDTEAAPEVRAVPDGDNVESAAEARPPAQRKADPGPRAPEPAESGAPGAAEPEVAEPEVAELRAEPGAAEPEVAEPDGAEPGAVESQAEPVADEPAAGAQPVGPAGKRATALRPSVRSAIVVAFLCGVLGFALAAQLRSNEGESQFANARQSDLVRILDELDSREDRLRGEIADLEFRRETINSRAQGSEAALADARRRTTELGILAGTVAAEGPGLMITLTEKPGERLAASTILDTIEELRGAGAEAMQIAGKEGVVVRIGASTYFADNGDEGIEVDGKRMAGPYVITVIGDPPTMESALRIPGGIVETVGQDGGDAMLAQSRTVRINAVRELREPKFARPAS